LLKKRSAVAVSGEQLLRQCYEKLQEHIRWRPVPPNQLGLRELPELVAGQSFSFAQEGFNAAQNKNLPNNIFNAGCTQGQEVQSNNMDIFGFGYDFNASFLLDSGAGVPGYDMSQLSNSFSWNPSLGRYVHIIRPADINPAEDEKEDKQECFHSPTSLS
jgi:hypothetical protein